MNRRPDDIVRMEAAAWVAQLESGPLARADVDALREWMARSPRHAAELKRLARLSDEMNVLTAMANPIGEAASHYRPVYDPRPKRKGLAAIALAAAVVAALWVGMEPEPALRDSLNTAVGEYKEHLLPDGSTISLNTASRLDINYDVSTREIVLHSGEVLFTVAHDSSRPFVVRAGAQRVIAVGTAFVVRLDESQVQVSVTEGKVRLMGAPQLTGTVVSASNADPDRHDTEVLLESGQSMTLPANEPERVLQAPAIETVSDEDMRRRLAWRDGLLDFNRTPLAQVVTEVSRHSGKRIIIADPELRSRKFDGLFRVGETDSLLRTLNLRPDIMVTLQEDGTVMVLPGDREHTKE